MCGPREGNRVGADELWAQQAVEVLARRRGDDERVAVDGVWSCRPARHRIAVPKDFGRSAESQCENAPLAARVGPAVRAVQVPLPYCPSRATRLLGCLVKSLGAGGGAVVATDPGTRREAARSLMGGWGPALSVRRLRMRPPGIGTVSASAAVRPIIWDERARWRVREAEVR